MADISKAIIDTLIAEAGGQGEESMRRVAETILNRSAIRGLTPEQVVQQPYQYTGYSNPGPLARQAQNNPAVQAAAQAAWQTALQPGDPTGGADHYYAPGTISQPSWARNMTPTGSYGGHNYYASRPIPPGEIPNAVGTALSVTPSAPNPVTMSPDLRLMRNPTMSTTASAQQATPYPVNQSLDMLIRRSPGTTIATIPTSNIGQPPTTTMAPSVPFNQNGNAYNEAARRAALLANQSYVGQGAGGGASVNNSTAYNDAARRAALLANQSYVGMESGGQLRNARLNPGVAAQNYSVAANGPAGLTRTQYAALGNPGLGGPLASIPAIMSAGLSSRRNGPLLPSSPVQTAVQAARALARPLQAPAPIQQAYMSTGSSPMRIVIDGANYPSSTSALTPVQTLQNQGYSPSQAYAMANANAAQRARDNASKPSSEKSDYFKMATGG